jgi:hypothetical protein
MKKFIANFAILIFIAGFTLTVPVFAQLEGNPENLCRNGFFPRESQNFQLARITGKPGERVYFYGDEREDCPKGKNCRRKSYLVPNDEIIVSRTFGGFACGWFQPKKGSETVGWIKVDNLEWIETDQRPEPKDWLGEWRFYENSIVISKSKTSESFEVKGDALWRGLGDNVHIGELDEQAKPFENKLKLGESETDEFACKVSMRLVGKYLVVSDNLNCGGANVTFSGVYRKGVKK